MLFLTGLSIVMLAGCSGSNSLSTVAQTEPPAQGPLANRSAGPPVDGRLVPVSLTRLSPDAKEALKLCVRDDEMDLVAGMAEVPSARDVPRYGWFFGNPPEFDTDAPAWVVQIDGDLVTRNGTYNDPTCVVIEGVRSFFLTGGSTNIAGEKRPRSVLAIAPEFALPPVQP